METLELLNAKTIAKAARKTLFGKEYLVAPMTLIVPGVLNGSQGALYYPPDEVSKNPEIWNHKPITLGHPPGGANDPDTLNKTQLGFLLNTRTKNGNLVADGWFDVGRLMQVSKDILKNLVAGTPTELSTGLSVDKEPAEGDAVHNGRKYEAIARNYRPDHLAILPDATGACSLSDGCGVLVNADGQPLVNALSHEQIRHMLHRELRSLFRQDEPGCFIMAVFDGFFIYEQGDKLLQRSYTVSDGKVSIGSDATEVRREEEFVPVSNSKDNEMSKKQLVDGLIANCSCWEESDRDTLNKLDDKKLQSMLDAAQEKKSLETVANAAKTGFADTNGFMHAWNEQKGEWESVPVNNAKTMPKGKADEDEEESMDKETTNKQLTAEEWFDQAPPEVQSVLRNAMDVENRERQQLIDQLTANLEGDAKDRLSNRLKDKPIDELRDLAELSPVKNADNPFRRANYSGQAAGGAPVENVQKPEPLGLPSWEFNFTK